MNLKNIRNLLSNGEIAANQINPLIDSLEIQDIDKLSEIEQEAFREVVNRILLLAQVPNSGAFIEKPEKAEALLSALDKL